MNNLRLLAGLVSIVLACEGVCSFSQQVVSLEDLFDYADRNSVQLRAAYDACEEADRGVEAERMERLPDISASLSLSYIGAGFTTRRDFSDYQRAEIPHLGTGVSVGVTQPLYTGGALTTALDIAELKSAGARFALEGRRDNLRFSITAHYLDLYKYSNIREVVESNISSAEHVLADMQSRYDEGLVLLNDITRYELLIENLKLQLVKVSNLCDILNTNLVAEVGLPASTVILPDTCILSRSFEHRPEEWWQTEADTSPAISLARNSVGLSRRSEDMVKAERRPHIGLEAAWNLDGPILVEVPPINRNLSYWYVGVGISYNLSSIFKSGKSLAQSKAATMKAVDELEALQQTVSVAVRYDYIRYLEAREELKARRKGVELALRNYKVISTRYAEGLALITDMLDAADARLDAQQRLVNAQIDIIYYYYKLLFTTGKI